MQAQSGTVFAESAEEDRSSPETRTRSAKALVIVSDVADVVFGFFKSLRATDWLLLGAVVVLLLVVVMMVFPSDADLGQGHRQRSQVAVVDLDLHFAWRCWDS